MKPKQNNNGYLPKDENFGLKQNINKHLVHIYFGFSAHFSFPNTDMHIGENSHIVHFTQGGVGGRKTGGDPGGAPPGPPLPKKKLEKI
jgi:hypothetical protein